MSKFFSFSLAAFLILVTLSVGFLVWRGKNESVAIILQAGDKKELEKPIIKSQPFFVSGWLPYWTKISGAAEFEKNISAFNEIHPFAFGVNVDGSLKDTLKIKEAPWSDLIVLAGKNKVAIVPTILWGDAAAMHNVFSNKNISDKHINAITAMLEKNNLSGVDIDYEGKDVTDRDLFSIFLKALHEKLTSSGKTLNCTIEARTQDDPPAGWSGTKAMAFANDYQVLNNFCDSVTVMAYDQAFQENGTKKTFENYDTDPHAPNANSQWTEKVIQYALRYIAPEKIILGVPTYGWEFTFAKTSNGYIYPLSKRELSQSAGRSASGWCKSNT